MLKSRRDNTDEQTTGETYDTAAALRSAHLDSSVRVRGWETMLDRNRCFS